MYQWCNFLICFASKTIFYVPLSVFMPSCLLLSILCRPHYEPRAPILTPATPPSASSLEWCQQSSCTARSGKGLPRIEVVQSCCLWLSRYLVCFVQTSCWPLDLIYSSCREMGGAYGGGARQGHDGVFRFFSYRDPNNLKTIERFENGIDWISEGSFTQQDVDEAKLSIFQTVSLQMAPIFQM